MRDTLSQRDSQQAVLSLLQETRMQVSLARLELDQINQRLQDLESRLLTCEDRLGLNSLLSETAHSSELEGGAMAASSSSGGDGVELPAGWERYNGLLSEAMYKGLANHSINLPWEEGPVKHVFCPRPILACITLPMPALPRLKGDIPSLNYSSYGQRASALEPIPRPTSVKFCSLNHRV